MERNTSGLSVLPKFNKLGTKGTEIAELAFDNWHIPFENRLGKEGMGFKNLSRILGEIRLMTAAKICGLTFLVFVACANRSPDWAERIKEGDYGVVKLGTYPYTTSQIRYDAEEWTGLRKEIEDRGELLCAIVRHFYPEEKWGLNFKYKFAAEDGDKIILRYFAMIPEVKDEATNWKSLSPNRKFMGYSVQFVFDSGIVCEIYLFKAPLE